ncbi:thiamine-phosphate kinase [Chloroflexota bacterium]
MKISDLGEFGLIDILTEMSNRTRDEKHIVWKKLIKGIGDDAAAWQGDNSIKLATTDFLIQGVHFPVEPASWQALGWKAMAANLSDIAAMGGTPLYALVSLALPGETEVDCVTDLYRGILEIANQHGAAIVGGDMSSAPMMIINITVLGSNEKRGNPILLRSTARPGEKIAVTGFLGASAAGLKMMQENLRLPTEDATCLRQAFEKPHPRIAEGQLLAEYGVRTAIDISDGLIQDLRHICQASHVGARVESEKIPIRPEVKNNFGEKALELALSGGEDYELLFTASTAITLEIQETTEVPVTVIGEITKDNTGKIILVDKDKESFSIRERGWNHFNKDEKNRYEPF